MISLTIIYILIYNQTSVLKSSFGSNNKTKFVSVNKLFNDVMLLQGSQFNHQGSTKAYNINKQTVCLGVWIASHNPNKQTNKKVQESQWILNKQQVGAELCQAQTQA